MSQPIDNEPTPFDIEVSPPVLPTPPPGPFQSLAQLAPVAEVSSEGVATTHQPAPELVEPESTSASASKPLVSGTIGAVLGIISLMAAAGAGFTSGLVQAALVVLALVAGLVVGKYAVEAPAFAAGKPLVQGPWLALSTAGALHLGNLATVLPPGLGTALATAGAAVCCLLAGLPFSRPAKK